MSRQDLMGINPSLRDIKYTFKSLILDETHLSMKKPQHGNNPSSTDIKYTDIKYTSRSLILDETHLSMKKPQHGNHNYPY